jgi:ATP-dependent helicase/nuclease subunit B
VSPELLAALAEGAIVVTPNRRLARFIHRDFDRAQRACGKMGWPTPSILPYPQWLQSLWAEALAADAVSESRLLLTGVQSALQWRHVVDADGDRVALFDPGGAAALAAEAWSLAHQWGAGGESWRAWRRGADDADDPAVFARWAEAYLAGLRKAESRDLALVPDALAELAGRLNQALRPTVFAGFLELTPQQGRLVAALRAAGAEVAHLDTLPELGPTVSRTIAATPRDEIAAALSWARERALARPESRIGVVVEGLTARRDEIVALAGELLCPAAMLPGATTKPAPFEISLGVPLGSVALIGVAVDLIALAESRLSVGAAAAVLRSPYLPDAEAMWARRAGAERDWLEQGKREVTLADALAALERSSPELAVRWRNARDARRGARPTSPREWADAWRAWLAAAGWPGSRVLDSGEYQARQAWERLVGAFVSLGAVAPRLAPVRALATLRALAVETLFQPEGGAAAIQILGTLEGTGLAFDALWVAGLTADRWPAAPSPNPLLPLAWQRERNMPRSSARREREFAEALTARFARAAAEVVFSSAASVDDHTLSPSALILAHPERPSPARPVMWAREISRGTALEQTSDDRAPPLAAGSRAPGGARIVAAQSDCPFQAVVRCRLRTEPWPAPCAGLTPLERGLLAHSALAAFWTTIGDHASLRALDQGGLVAHIAAAVEHALAQVPAARWRVLPSLLRGGEASRLTVLLRTWLAVERARPPFAVQAIEAPASLRLAGLEFRLRRDRVDTLADGGVAILDYKTGQVERPRQWFDDRPRAAQLGLYTLVQRDASAEVPVRAAAYAELRPDGVAAVGLAADAAAWPALDSVATVGPAGTWSGLEAWWRAHLEALATEIAAGHAAVTPRAAPSPCRNCGLQPVCRIESVRGYDPGERGDE